jgi:hypothetical protein
MSKKNGQPEQTLIPGTLQGLIAQASKQITPKLSQGDKERLPALWECLLPFKTDDPKHKGEGKPKQVWVEPLLMVSWDRGLGQWKVAISHKTFSLTTSTVCPELHACLVAMNDALVNNCAVVRERID